MRHLISALVFAGIMLLISSTGTAQSIDSDQQIENAYWVCAIADNTGMTTQECEVEGWGEDVNIYFDVSAMEARVLCRAFVEKAKNTDRVFPGWEIHIYSPYSGDRTLAQCDLSE